MFAYGQNALCSRKVLVTGASGFVGSAVVARLVADGCDVAGAVRRPISARWGVRSPTLGKGADWGPLLADKAVIIHTAARAHVLEECLGDPLVEFRAINVHGTMNLAEQALRAGIRRFIFISSIGVNGNQTFEQPFREGDTPNPQEPYAISKLEAEVSLSRLFATTHAELVIVRPPLVYGPNPPGNFLRLLKFAASGLPIPLGAIHNKRSLVALDNLVDLIVTCIDHPAAANQTFLVSDGEDISTTQLLLRMGDALGKPARLFPVPVWMLEAGAAMFGKRDLSRRLCGNLQVDISKTRDLLGWAPPVSMDEGLRITAARYLAWLAKGS